jgi:hypothetical protein
MLRKVGAALRADQVREAETQAEAWMKKLKKLLK